MTIKPIGNRLVVKLVKQKQKTSSGIIIATEEKNEQSLGEIIAVGEGSGEDDNIKDLKLKAGEKVMFKSYTGEEVKDPEKADDVYKILDGKDVLAVIKD